MFRKAATLIISITILIVLTIGCTPSPIIGQWYQEAGYGSIEFKDGGDCMVYVTDIPLEGTYVFDQKSSQGEITIDFLGDVTTKSFKLKDDLIIYEGETYTTDYVEQKEFGEALDEALDQAFDDIGEEIDE